MLHVVPYAIWPAKRWRDEIGLSCCPLDPPHTSPVRSRKCALRAPGRSSLKRSVPELKPYDRDQNLKASSSCAGGPSLRDLISPVRLGDRTALAGFRPQSVSAFHHRLADEFFLFLAEKLIGLISHLLILFIGMRSHSQNQGRLHYITFARKYRE